METTTAKHATLTRWSTVALIHILDNENTHGWQQQRVWWPTLGTTNSSHHHPLAQVVRHLRDDNAFMLTYYFGRVGLTSRHVSVGHPLASLLQLEAGSAQASAEIGKDPAKKR